MKYTYARIDLSKTDYPLMANARVISRPNARQLKEIYKQYCEFKKFDSVMPLFDNQFFQPNHDVMVYFQDSVTAPIAFSLIARHDADNAECLQFAWDYADPKLRLGINSLKHECSYYKSLGFKYYYLGGADEYKQQIDGFETLGRLE